MRFNQVVELEELDHVLGVKGIYLSFQVYDRFSMRLHVCLNLLKVRRSERDGEDKMVKYILQFSPYIYIDYVLHLCTSLSSLLMHQPSLGFHPKNPEHDVFFCCRIYPLDLTRPSSLSRTYKGWQFELIFST